MTFKPMYLVQIHNEKMPSGFDVSEPGESLDSIACDIARGDYYDSDEIVAVYRVAMGELVEDVTEQVIALLVEKVRAGREVSRFAKKLMMREPRGMAA